MPRPYDMINSLGPYRDHEAEQPARCAKCELSWSNYCGAYVCSICGTHYFDKEGTNRMAKCFCGWPAGEKLEDDIGEATFDGEAWEVDY